MKIESTDKTVKGVLSQGYYKIPRFQRPFSWEKDQIDEFWTDTISEMDSDYFIGSIVVYQEDKTHEELGIVDGQQRLTTITLILCALRNAFKSEGLTDFATGVHSLIERNNINNVPEYVIQPESSYPYFQEHIQKNSPPDTHGNAGEEERLLKLAFEFVSKNIQDSIDSIKADKSISDKNKPHLIKEKLIEIRDKVLGLKLIHITLDNEDDAYIIFETLNSRGRNLTISDLLKSYLFKPIKKSNANVDVFREKWAEILKVLTDGKVTIDEYLYHHWLSKYERYIPAKRLFKSIKKKIPSNKARNYFNELSAEVLTYRKIVSPTLGDWGKNDTKIFDSLKALKIFSVKQPIPFVLSLLRELSEKKLKPSQVVDALWAVEKFHFIFSAITSQRSSGGISSIYTKHAIELCSKDTPEGKAKVLVSLKSELDKRIPGYQEFEANFNELNYTENDDRAKKLVQYILAKIHLHHQADIPINFDAMTIEHISPQRPKKGPPLNNVGKIGNLILLTQTTNGDLNNMNFKEKVAALKHLKIWIDDDIKSATSWGLNEVDLRTQKLANLAYSSIWK